MGDYIRWPRRGHQAVKPKVHSALLWCLWFLNPCLPYCHGSHCNGSCWLHGLGWGWNPDLPYSNLASAWAQPSPSQPCLAQPSRQIGQASEFRIYKFRVSKFQILDSTLFLEVIFNISWYFYNFQNSLVYTRCYYFHLSFYILQHFLNSFKNSIL